MNDLKDILDGLEYCQVKLDELGAEIHSFAKSNLEVGFDSLYLSAHSPFDAYNRSQHTKTSGTRSPLVRCVDA